MTGALGLYSLGEGLSGLGVTFGGCIIVLILIWLICFLFSHPKLLGTLVLIGVGWGVYEVVNMVKEDNHKKKYSSEQIVTNNSFKISDFGISFINNKIKNINLYDWSYQEIIAKDTIYEKYSTSYIIDLYADGNDLDTFVYGITDIEALNDSPYLIKYDINKCAVPTLKKFLIEQGFIYSNKNIKEKEWFCEETYYPYDICLKKDDLCVEIDTTSIEGGWANTICNVICVYNLKKYYYVKNDVEENKHKIEEKEEMIKEQEILSYLNKN